MTIVPNSRKTYDPEYKKAKESLKNYIISTKKIINSIQILGERALAISKCYSKLCAKTAKWFPDSPPAVHQSLQSITQSAENLNKMTSDDLIKIVVPHFEKTLKDYKKKTNELLSLEKKRRTAVHAYDRDKEKLRQAQCAREPDEEKIDHCQRQVNATEETYNTLNDQYILAVNDFSDHRKTEFLRSLYLCFNDLMKYINKTTQLTFIKFPDDPNSPLIVDAKTVNNHDDASLHINQSQILPPAAPSSGMPSQMPVYIHNGNNYSQTYNNSPIQPPAPGYADRPNSYQNNGQNFYQNNNNGQNFYQNNNNGQNFYQNNNNEQNFYQNNNGPQPVPLPPSPVPYQYGPGYQQNTGSNDAYPYTVDPQTVDRGSNSSQLITSTDNMNKDSSDDDDITSTEDNDENENKNNENNNNDNEDNKKKKSKKGKKHWTSRKSKCKKSRASKPYF